MSFSFSKSQKILFLFLLFGTSFVFCQNKWQYLGAPSGGYVTCFAEGPNNYLYAGTQNASVYRSTDNGVNWSSISNGLFNFNNGIKCLSVTKNNIVFAGTYSALYRSSNNGDSWEKPTSFFDKMFVFDLAAIDNKIYAATTKGLFISTDNGNNWFNADLNLPQDEILSIGIRGNILIVIYNGGNHPMYISTNGGYSWDTKSKCPGGTAYDILIDTEKSIFSATLNGMYKSTDMGLSWSKINDGITVHSSEGIFAITEDTNGKIYCAQNENVYKLNNDKCSWSVFDTSLFGFYPRSLLVSSKNTLFIGDLIHGVVYYPNLSTRRNDAIFPASFIDDLNTGDPNHFYCIATMYYGGFGSVFVSHDAGRSWVKTGLDSIIAGQILIMRNGHILCSDRNNGYSIPATKGFSISSDQGNTWNRFNNGIPLKEYIPGKFVTAPIGYMDMDSNGNVFSSIDDPDGGPDLCLKLDYSQNRWLKTTIGIYYNTFFKMIDVNTFLLSGGSSYTLGNDGSVKSLTTSVDSRRDYNPADYDSMNKIFYTSSHEAIGYSGHFVTGYNAKIYKANSGNPYKLLLNIDSTVINDLKVDKLGNIYLATSKGIFTSKDFGETWKESVDELKKMNIYTIKIGADNSIFAILPTGLYKLMNYDTVKVVDDIPSTFSLSQNYPNPFNPSTTINYSIASAGNVTLKVYDMLGREVATLVNEYKQPGNYNSQFSIVNYQLASGVYFYRLQAGSFSQTKKLILMK